MVTQVQDNLILGITYNGSIPMEGPISINAPIEIPDDLSVIEIDLKHEQTLGKTSGIQSVYIDLYDFANDVVLITPMKQRIVARAGTQGYYQVLCDNNMKFTVSSNLAGKFNIFFLNFPVATVVW